MTIQWNCRDGQKCMRLRPKESEQPAPELLSGNPEFYSSPSEKDCEAPRVNRMLYVGRLRQNDGYYTEGSEWVRAEDARQLERELWEEKDATNRMFGRYIEASQRADNAEMLLKAAQSATGAIHPCDNFEFVHPECKETCARVKYGLDQCAIKVRGAKP